MTSNPIECSLDINKAAELHDLCARIHEATFKSHKADKNTVVLEMTIGDDFLTVTKSGAEKSNILRHQCVAEIYDDAIVLIKKHCGGELPTKKNKKKWEPRKKRRMPSAEEFAKGKSLWEQFNARWPLVFNKDEAKPLVIGVDKEVTVDGHFTPEEAKAFFSYWTRRWEYGEAMMSNDTRFHLDGTASGLLTRKEREIYRKAYAK